MTPDTLQDPLALENLSHQRCAFKFVTGAFNNASYLRIKQVRAM